MWLLPAAKLLRLLCFQPTATGVQQQLQVHLQRISESSMRLIDLVRHISALSVLISTSFQAVYTARFRQELDNTRRLDRNLATDS